MIFFQIYWFDLLVVYIKWPSIAVSASTSVLSSEHSGLISFRMGWLHLIAVQGTHKSLLQHHHSEASILRGSAFFMVQLCVHSCCCSHAFCETHSLGRTMQRVECSVLHWWPKAESPLAKDPTSSSENLIYPKCTCPNPPPQVP